MDLDWEKNLSNTDRVIRAVIGLLLLAPVYGKVLTGWWAATAVALALFQFIEATFAY